MQQTCAPLGRPRQTSATRLTNAAGPTTAKCESDEPGPAPQAPSPQALTTDGTKKPASTTTDWFMPLHPAGAGPAHTRKTYRDVDTGVSWDAP